MAATHFLPSLVGPSTTALLLLTGKIVSADEALQLGLVSQVSLDSACQTHFMYCKKPSN